VRVTLHHQATDHTHREKEREVRHATGVNPTDRMSCRSIASWVSSRLEVGRRDGPTGTPRRFMIALPTSAPAYWVLPYNCTHRNHNDRPTCPKEHSPPRG
jgi:hypothetical protein